MGIRTSPVILWKQTLWRQTFRFACTCACTALLLSGMAVAASAQSRGEQQRDAADAAKLVELLGVTEGQSVADIGAGEGPLTVAMAKTVGAKGRVYSTDLG